MNKEQEQLLLNTSELSRKMTDRMFITEDNVSILHKYLSSLIVDYCARLAELSGESPVEIYNSIKEKVDDFPTKPESHLYVVR